MANAQDKVAHMALWYKLGLAHVEKETGRPGK